MIASSPRMERARLAVNSRDWEIPILRQRSDPDIISGMFLGGDIEVSRIWNETLLMKPPRASPIPTSESRTQILSGRDSDGSETESGSVLGTPAYMALEQAVGAIEQVDERSDVFGLGGVLAVILTGRPPYVSDTAESTRVLAARGKVEECFALLDTCGADPELVDLCKRCLSPEREDRPASAGVVASAVAGFAGRGRGASPPGRARPRAGRGGQRPGSRPRRAPSGKSGGRSSPWPPGSSGS